MDRLRSALGILIILAVAYAICPRSRRKHVNWRTVLIGLGLLLVAAVIVLKTPARVVFAWGNAVVESLIEFANRGAEFVFGSLSHPDQSAGFVFAFNVLPTILFFAALTSLLYYLRVMPFIVRVMGKFLSRTLGTSGAESFSTVADIFVGQTEAPLVIKPYIRSLTLSELNACMVAGFATTAGGVLAAYVSMLRDLVPDIGGHLIACSVMCAPASLIIAKLVLPETEPQKTAGAAQIEIPRTEENLLGSLAAGTTDGARLAVNVGAMLVVFVALAYMLNAAFVWFGANVLQDEFSLDKALGFVFSPLAWTIGVPMEDVGKVGGLLGSKTVFTELYAYNDMSVMLKHDPHWLTERGRLLASYALCGFANLASIGIQIGGYSALAPERRGDLTRLAFRAMIAGMLATCLVACVTGIFL
ncbi:MAG TPA: nucleoside transporter C-terminal domain-containing protein [Planctomycetota bacterium]|nr:nucleoside transporter C-terminal domain-containing protein [Planctomycetota bacterium]